MAVFQPTPAFKFQVFLFDAGTGLPKSIGAALAGAGKLALGFTKTFLFGAFSEASGINAELEVEEYREGGRNDGPHKFMKWGRFPNLVLRRGVTFNADLWDWQHQVLFGKSPPIRKHAVILLNDRGGGALPADAPNLGIPGLNTVPVAGWFMRNGLPEKLIGPALNARSSEIAIEQLDIAHEGLMRLGPGLIPRIGEALTRVGI